MDARTRAPTNMSVVAFLYTYLFLALCLVGLEAWAWWRRRNDQLITELSKAHWYLRALILILFVLNTVWWVGHSAAHHPWWFL